MDTTIPAENLSVKLSREELLFLLFTLKADSILGLDPEPLGNLSPDQKNLSLLFAERALRARDLVSVGQDGGLVVRETLLLMIATCAYAEMVIALHHFPSTGFPRQTFWHVRSGVAVAHTRPEAPLHRFAFAKDRMALQQQILDGCILFDPERVDYPEIVTTNDLLNTAREGVLQDKSKTAQVLTSNGIDDESAEEFCSILAGEHAVSALHVIATKPDKTILQESVTILSGPTSTWLMTEREDEKVSLKAIGRSILLDLLEQWTSKATLWPDISGVLL